MNSYAVAPFGELLLAFRSRGGMTQTALATALGMHRNTIGRWEHGEVLPDTNGTVLEIARLLHLDDPETRQLLEASLTGLSPYWTVPFPRHPFFTGRETILAELHARLSADRAIGDPAAWALCGVGGIGKTQLAIEYAYRHALEYHGIFWLAAEHADHLLASLYHIAEALHLSERHAADQQLMVAAVRRWLSHHRGWLLIADNVADLDLLVSVLPSVRQGALLITTQLQALGGVAEGLALPPMSLEEGTAFLLRRARRQSLLSQDVAAAELVRLVGGLPLALDQVGAYLEDTGCSLTEYHQVYAQHRSSLLARRGSVAGEHPASVVATVRLAIQAVEQCSQSAVALLHCCAFLSPEAIPEDLFLAGASHLGPLLAPLVTDHVRFDESVAVLRRYSLIQRHQEMQTLALHRLVQIVLRDEMDLTTARMWSERVVRAVLATFPDVEYAHWPQCEQWLPSALTSLRLIDLKGRFMPEASGLLLKVGTYLFQRCRFAEAEPVLAQALNLEEIQKGSTHPDLIPFLIQRAALAFRMGDMKLAASTIHQALILSEQFLEPDHLLVGHTLVYMAGLAWRRGDYAEAEERCRRAQAIFAQHLGRTHPETLDRDCQLAHMLREQGRYGEAEVLFQQTLACCEQILSPTHPQSIKALEGLAAVYGSQEHLRELAIAAFEQVLDVREQQWGSDHVETAHVAHNLGIVYRDQGNYARAQPLLHRALVLFLQHLGQTHPTTANALSNLGRLEMLQGHSAEAKPYFDQSLKICEASLEASHPQTARVLEGLAELAQSQGQREQALHLYRHALGMYQRHFGPDHSHIQQIQEDLVILLGSGEPIEPPTSLSVLSSSEHEELSISPLLGKTLVTTFATIPDNRAAQGRRYPLATILALATAAMLEGARSLYAITQWGAIQPSDITQTLGFAQGKPPVFSTVYEAFQGLSVKAFETALCAWMQQAFGDPPDDPSNDAHQVQGLHGNIVPGAGILAAYRLPTDVIRQRLWGTPSSALRNASA